MDSLTDADLLTQFESCILPGREWTHHAHIRVAWMYLKRLGYDAGLDEIRRRIKAFNAVHHTPETVMRGYNETITVAYARLVWAAMGSESTSEQFSERHPELMSHDILKKHYSPERVFNLEAKVRFVEPDLEPLPEKL